MGAEVQPYLEDSMLPTPTIQSGLNHAANCIGQDAEASLWSGFKRKTGVIKLEGRAERKAKYQNQRASQD